MQEIISNIQTEKFNLQFSRINSLMNMIAVPYLGVYSNTYTFMIPINVLKKNQIAKNSLELFPENLKKHLADLKSEIEFDHFMITLDGSYLISQHNKTDFLRMNFVPHPYIFHDIKNLEKDHHTYIFSCLYSEDPFHDSYLRETFESDGLRINPEVFMSDQNKKEIILHKSYDNSPAISPNNCSFLINVNKSFFTFYSLTAVTYMNKLVKFSVVQFNIFNHIDVLALSPLLESFIGLHLENFGLIRSFLSNIYNSIENFKYVFYALYTNLSRQAIVKEKEFNSLSFLRNLFNSIYFRKKCEYDDSIYFRTRGDYNDTSNYMLNEGVDIKEYEKIFYFHYNSLCYFIWFNMGKCNISELGEKILNSSDPSYFVEIVKIYMNYIFKGLDFFFSTYVAFFADEIENENLKYDGMSHYDINSYNNQLVDKIFLDFQFRQNKCNSKYLTQYFKIFR
jgi:hypothetical protein